MSHVKKLHMRHYVFASLVVLCAGCASDLSSKSIKVQSDSRQWTAISGQMPRGETFLIMVPDRSWPAFTEGKAGTATSAQARKAAEDYITQQKLSCSVETVGNEMAQGGWPLNLTCPPNTGLK